MRAFLAIPVGPPALGEVISLGERLRAELDGVRWASLDTAHITLHFFGSLSPADAERALAAVQPVVSSRPAPRLQLSGLGCFPSEPRARVLWMGAAGEVAALAALACGCVATLEAEGFAVEQRAYRPHCTLGRLRTSWGEAARLRWRALADEQPATSWFVADRVLLYESVTAAGGATHVPRAAIPLSASS